MNIILTTKTGSTYMVDDSGTCTVTRKDGHYMGDDTFPTIGFRTRRLAWPANTHNLVAEFFDLDGNLYLTTSTLESVVAA